MVDKRIFFASPEAKKDADKMMDMVTKLAQKVHKGLNGEFCRTPGLWRGPRLVEGTQACGGDPGLWRGPRLVEGTQACGGDPGLWRGPRLVEGTQACGGT